MSSGMVHASQQSDLHFIVNGTLLALVHQNILSPLCCHSRGWHEYLVWRRRVDHVPAAQEPAQHHMYYIGVKP